MKSESWVGVFLNLPLFYFVEYLKDHITCKLEICYYQRKHTASKKLCTVSMYARIHAHF